MARSHSSDSLQFQTDWTAERAFFQRKVGSLLCILFEDDRSLSGLAGAIDWRLQGQISKLLREGRITGKLGERVYLPVHAPSGDTHSRIFLVGAGQRSSSAKKNSQTGQPSEACLRDIQTGFLKIGVGPIGISQSDFDESSEAFYKKWFSQLPFWVFR